MQVLPYVKAAFFLIVIGVVVWLMISVFAATEAATYVNQTAFPLRFLAIRLDDPRYRSQVVVPAHSEMVVQLPKNAPAIRIVATRPDGSVAFDQAYGISDLARDHDRIVVTPVPILP